MTRVEQANAIHRQLSDWMIHDADQRSQSVLNWCAANGIVTRLTAPQLSAAMAKMPYWSQGPRDYLDFVIAYSAAQSA